MDNDLFDFCHDFNTFDITLTASNGDRRKIASVFAVAFDSVAEECNLLYAIVLILGNSAAKQIISYSGMYLVDFCGILQGWNSLLWTTCFHIQTHKGLEKTSFGKKKMWVVVVIYCNTFHRLDMEYVAPWL